MVWTRAATNGEKKMFQARQDAAVDRSNTHEASRDTSSRCKRRCTNEARSRAAFEPARARGRGEQHVPEHQEECNGHQHNQQLAAWR